MKSLIYTVLIFLFINTSFADDWTAREKILGISYITLNVVDLGQTIYGLNRGCSEMNPLLGKHPTPEKLYLLKGISLGAMYFLVDEIGQGSRETFLWCANILQLGIVIWNGHQNSQMKFQFKLNF